MKHIVYILLTLILLASCQKDEAFDISEGKGTLILENLSVQTEKCQYCFYSGSSE